MQSVMYRAGWKLLDILFPPSCGGCGQWGEKYCPECLKNTQLIRKPIFPKDVLDTVFIWMFVVRVHVLLKHPAKNCEGIGTFIRVATLKPGAAFGNAVAVGRLARRSVFTEQDVEPGVAVVMVTEHV